MANRFDANLESFAFDKTGRWCILRFWPYRPQNNVEETYYYSVVSSEQIHAYGSIPSVCSLLPLDEPIPESKLFFLDSKLRPASFEGVSYHGQNSSKKPFWYFDFPRTINQFMKDVKQFVPNKANEIIGAILKQAQKEFSDLKK